MMTVPELLEALKQARADADWARISELNALTQPCVEAAMQVETVDLQALQPVLQQLSDLYQGLQQECTQYRDSLAAQLGEVSAGREATRQYSANSSL